MWALGLLSRDLFLSFCCINFNRGLVCAIKKKYHTHARAHTNRVIHVTPEPVAVHVSVRSCALQGHHRVDVVRMASHVCARDTTAAAAVQITGRGEF